MLDKISIGKQIHSLRKLNGFTQEEMAVKLKISAQAISKWENGHTLPETALLPLLAKLFNCSIDSILMPWAEHDTAFRDFVYTANGDSGELAVQFYEKMKGMFSFPIIYNDEYEEYHSVPGGRSARFNYLDKTGFIVRVDRKLEVTKDYSFLARIALPSCSEYMQIIDNMPEHIKKSFRCNDCSRCAGFECSACMIYTFEGIDYRQCHFITIPLDSVENFEYALTLITAEVEGCK